MAAKNIEFTERLRKLIKEELKMSNNAFADMAGIGHSTIGNYFNKQNYGRVPEWDQLLKISKASGKTVDWLLTGKEAESSLHKSGGEFSVSVKNAIDSLGAMKELFQNIKREMLILHDAVKNSKKAEDKFLSLINRQQQELAELSHNLRGTGYSRNISRLKKAGGKKS
jgi:transcriptional regulator with XRE-family HTH domain